MTWVPRKLSDPLEAAAKAFPVVILTGPRRSGKTTLLTRTFPDASWLLMEDPDLIARFRADPRSFVDRIDPPAILDEIQHVPEVLNYVRTLVDAEPERMGRWFLTGSQEAPLMRGVTESMAGRAAVLQLLPFSREESDQVSVLGGGYPEAVLRPDSRKLWLRSCVQTYLERDVRSVTAVRDLVTFRRFLALVASRTGQFLNRTALAGPLGVSVPTVSSWLGVLEITGQILLVPPFYESFGKRIVKSPKLYFLDSGLACHLLGVESVDALDRSPFLGPIFEGYVASEIVKHQSNRGASQRLYTFRDRQGLEVDFLVDLGDRRLALVEAKASRTPRPEDARPLHRLARSIEGYEPTRFVVHRTPRGRPSFEALAPGVRALTVDRLHEIHGR
jgi:predicted AAA+ superfamily ATPase